VLTKTFLKMMKQTKDGSYCLNLTLSEGQYLISIDEIIRLEASGNYTRIYLQNHRALFSARVLKSFVAILQPRGFIRTHRSHLVNQQFISGLQGSAGITLLSGFSLPVAKRKKRILRELLSFNSAG
jgi:two-component system, LytTR family, response regulator